MRNIWQQTVLVISFLVRFSSYAEAKPVIVQVVNGKSDKPISKAKLFVSFGISSGRQSVQLFTDKNGEARFDDGGFDVFQVHPVALVACGEQPIGAKLRDYSIVQILKSGIKTANDCGDSKRQPISGRLIYYFRPATWLELFKN